MSLYATCYQNNESALHFACKFGHVEMVEVLSAHPRIDKDLRNKYGETPRQVGRVSAVIFEMLVNHAL